jgi:hypothetical protein
MSITSAARAVALVAICTALVVGHAGPPAPKAEKAEKPKAPPAPLSEKQIVEQLDRLISFDDIEDPKITLRDFLQLLQRKHAGLAGVRFAVNKRAFQRAFGEPRNALDEVVGKVDGGRMTAAQFLSAGLTNVNVPSGAGFLVRRGRIEITTEEALWNEIRIPVVEEEGPPAADEGPSVIQHFPPIIYYLEANDEKLADVLEKLAARAEATIVIDSAAKEKAEGAKVKATLRNVSLPTAVKVLAEMAGLAVTLKSNVYYVTTPANVKKPTRRRIMVIPPVGDDRMGP